MKVLDNNGLATLWAKIKATFMALPSNHATATAKQVLTKTASSYEWANAPEGIGDAPADSNPYARQDNTWVKITTAECDCEAMTTAEINAILV